jgi:hypothetical protein
VRIRIARVRAHELTSTGIPAGLPVFFFRAAEKLSRDPHVRSNWLQPAPTSPKTSG